MGRKADHKENNGQDLEAYLTPDMKRGRGQDGGHRPPFFTR